MIKNYNYRVVKTFYNNIFQMDEIPLFQVFTGKNMKKINKYCLYHKVT